MRTQIPSNWGAQKEPIRVTNDLVNGLTPSPGATGQPEGNPSTHHTHARDADDRLSPPPSSSPSPVIVPALAASKSAPQPLSRFIVMPHTSRRQTRPGGCNPACPPSPEGMTPPETWSWKEGTPRALENGMGQTPASEPEKPHRDESRVTLQEGLTSGSSVPHPSPSNGGDIVPAEGKGSRASGFGPPTCGHRQARSTRSYASPEWRSTAYPGTT